uniref:Triple gene block protein 1 n=1 Tax=Nerine latent virus TaxID=797075 RepID=A0A8E6YK98_9VIRU|nr:triple gene block protein 1 [Nerine latent virus]
MDIALSLIREKTVCINNNLKDTIVVNCVPGFGKSTLIREILSKSRTFRAYTFGVPDPNSLDNLRIRSINDFVAEEGCHVIIDEYTEGNFTAFKPKIIFGDPNQTGKKVEVQCNFIGTETKRFGKSTCKFLNARGYQINSSREDELLVEYIYSGEPIGVIIAVEEEVKKLLRAHHLSFKDEKSSRGETYDEVTFVTSDAKRNDCEYRWKSYIATTRHRNKLLILSGDAFDATS